MPRTLPPAFIASLSGGVLSFSTLVKLTRTDGLVLGFTDSDVEIIHNSVTYKPTDGLRASSISSAPGTGIDNMESTGFLSDDRITEADLIAGRWGLAKVELSIYDRTSGTSTLPLISGRIGEITIQEQVFTAEVRSLVANLKTVVGDLTSPLCRCTRLGDVRCKFNLAGNVDGRPAQSTRTVSSVTSKSVFRLGSESAPTDFYIVGTIKFTSGLNAGIERDIKSHTLISGTAEITTRKEFPFTISNGDTALITVGCLKDFDTCRTRFVNHLNFHGENALLGNEKMTMMGRNNG